MRVSVRVLSVFSLRRRGCDTRRGAQGDLACWVLGQVSQIRGASLQSRFVLPLPAGHGANGPADTQSGAEEFLLPEHEKMWASRLQLLLRIDAVCQQ